MAKKRKSIALTHEAYSKLKARKLPGETFTDVILRLAGWRRRPSSDFVGILSPKSAESIQRAIEGDRKDRPKIDMEISKARQQIREGKTVSFDQLRDEE